jgi:hypothetical protein
MIMVIESRTMIGAAGALAIVGAGLWVTLSATTPPPAHSGTVEIQQVQERSWAVEIKDLGDETVTTVASRK